MSVAVRRKIRAHSVLVEGPKLFQREPHKTQEFLCITSSLITRSLVISRWCCCIHALGKCLVGDIQGLAYGSEFGKGVSDMIGHYVWMTCGLDRIGFTAQE